MRSEIGRRRFLKQASLLMLALPASAIARHGIRTKVPSDENLLPLQNQLLNLVNEERTAAGLTVLKLDELACTVAEQHAIGMAENVFLSHWGRDGASPINVTRSPAELMPSKKTTAPPITAPRSLPKRSPQT